MRKAKRTNGMHKIKCAGCGRYEKEVSENVIKYFCCNCFIFTPNYLRFKQGKTMLKPISDVKRGDMVKDIFGNILKITKKAYSLKENTYFFCYNVKDKKKEETVVADFHIVQKIHK